MSLFVTVIAAVPVGIGFSLNIPFLNAALQELSPERFRGRVMSVFAMAHLGVRPLFAVLAGGLASVAGVQPALVFFAALALVGVRSRSAIYSRR